VQVPVSVPAKTSTTRAAAAAKKKDSNKKKVVNTKKKSAVKKEPVETKKPVASKNQAITIKNVPEKEVGANNPAPKSKARIRGIIKLSHNTATNEVSTSDTLLAAESPSSLNDASASTQSTKSTTSKSSDKQAVANEKENIRERQQVEHQQQQLPLSSVGISSPHRGPGKRVKPPREEEEYVHVLERNVKNRYYNRYQCKQCELVFEGNADLIPRHITGIRQSNKSSNRGLRKCPNPDPDAYEKFMALAANATHYPCKSPSPKKRKRDINSGSLHDKDSNGTPRNVGIRQLSGTNYSSPLRRRISDESNIPSSLAAQVALNFLFRN
jgi:hypothetical protein